MYVLCQTYGSLCMTAQPCEGVTVVFTLASSEQEQVGAACFGGALLWQKAVFQNGHRVAHLFCKMLSSLWTCICHWSVHGKTKDFMLVYCPQRQCWILGMPTPKVVCGVRKDDRWLALHCETRLSGIRPAQHPNVWLLDLSLQLCLYSRGQYQQHSRLLGLTVRIWFLYIKYRAIESNAYQISLSLPWDREAIAVFWKSQCLCTEKKLFFVLVTIFLR